MPKEFFARYGAMLIKGAHRHDSDVPGSRLAWELDCYRKVAEAHHLTVSKEQFVDALVHLAAALARSVCQE